MKAKIKLDSVINRTKDQVSCDLRSEAVILNQKDSVYYGLNEVGASVWKLIKEPKKVREVINAILEEYNVDKNTCTKDILRIVEELERKNLIEVNDGASG